MVYIYTFEWLIFVCLVIFPILVKTQIPPSSPSLSGDSTFSVGDTGSFTCSSSGGLPDPSVVWYRNGNLVDDTYALTSGSANTGGTVTNTVTFTVKASDHYAVFECQVDNGVTLDPLKLTKFLLVRSTPSFPVLVGPSSPRPQQQNTWTCTSIGSFPPAYMSMRRGNQQYSNEFFSTSQQIIGTTKTWTITGTLTWTPTTSNNGEILYCDVTHDTLTTPHTVDLTLTVGGLPIVNIVHLSYSVIFGSTVTLACTVSANPTHTTVYWQKVVNGVSTTLTISNSKYSGSTVNTPSLTINNADQNDVAFYVCYATNSVGTGQSSQTYLDVIRSIPIVNIDNPYYSVIFGSTVTLVCTVTANPTHTTVYWQKVVNGVSTTLTISNNKYSGSTVNTPSLTINNADQNDVAFYVCYANNSVGTGQSSQTYLGVIGSILSVVVAQPQYSVNYGNSVTLVCYVSGTPSATSVYWQKLRNEQSTIISNTNDNKYSGSTVQNPSLTINNAVDSDGASYTCFATNSFGTGQSQPIILSITGSICSDGFHLFEEANITVNFMSVIAGSTAVSKEICITDKERMAKANCIHQQEGKPELINFVLNPKCFFDGLQSSPVTNILANLSTMPVDDENRRTIIDLLKNVTSNTDILTSLDVIYSVAVLVNLSNETMIGTKTFRDVLDITNNILEVNEDILATAQKRGSATNRILEVVDSLQRNVDLDDKTSIQILTPNILAEVYNVTTMESPVIGIQIEGANNQSLTASVIDRLFVETNISLHSLDAAIILPVEVVKGGNTRVSLNIYRDLKLFNVSPENKKFLPNSRVVAASVTVDGRDIRSLGGYKVQTIYFPRINSELNKCGYWNYDIYDNSGGWATDGCYLNRTVLGRLLCVCDHLTNFAVLITIGGQDALEEGIAIQIITWIGLILSIIGLSLTVLSFICFRNWRKEHAQQTNFIHLRRNLAQQTLLNLALALLCFLITFAAGIKQTQNANGCIVVAVLLHYFVLVAFMWMLVEGVVQYLLFVKVLGTYIPYFIHKSAMLAWGLPLIPVIAVLVTNYELYRGGNKACWMSLTAFYYAFVIPVGIIMVANIVIFMLVVRNLFRQAKGLQSNQSERKRAIMNFRASVSVFILLGLTWIFGFFTVEEANVVFQYIFTILNVFQGLFIFLLFTAREPRLRRMCCKTKQDKYKQDTKTSEIKPCNQNDSGEFSGTMNPTYSDSNIEINATT